MTDRPLITLLVPAYNEAATIEDVLRRVAALDLNTEIIVVDDGSTDGTPEIAERLAAEPARAAAGASATRRNRGKGAAVRTGIDESRGDIVLIQDADLEYDPRTCPSSSAPILEGLADVVYGTRLRGGQPQRAHLFWHYVGNRFLTLLTNVLYNTTISDMEVGYKAFTRRPDPVAAAVSEDFGFEPEVTAKLLRRGGRAPLRDPGLLLRPHLRGGQEDHLARRRHARWRCCCASASRR